MSATKDRLFKLGFDRNQPSVERRMLSSSGIIPSWLQGSFIRNGPGLFYVGKQRFKHWFDGLAMLHKFDFDQGKVHYQSKFLECQAAYEALNRDKLTYAEFATDPCWGLFGRMRSLFKHGPTDSAKVSLARIGDQYFALGETTMQIEFDLNTLDSLSTYNFKQPKFGTSSTAHPHLDGKDTYNLITRYGPVNRYQILKMDESATRVASVNTLTPSYMHSFGMSEKYFVIAESPFTVQSILLMIANRPFIENFQWHEDRGTRIWVIDRETSKVVVRKEIEPFFFFHFVNAFDIDGILTFDLVTYPDADIIKSYYLDNIRNPNSIIPGGTLQRFAIDLDSKQVHSRILSEDRIELPHMDYKRYNMKGNYQYVYAMSLSGESAEFYNEVVKIDVMSGKSTSWQQEGCYPGEPVFIPGPDATSEDHGVVLTLVLDVNNGGSFLLVLDALSFKELGRVQTPDPILIGFHGNYFEKQLI